MVVIKRFSGQLLLSSKTFLTEKFIKVKITIEEISREIISSREDVLKALIAHKIIKNDPKKSRSRKSETKNFNEKKVLEILKVLEEKNLSLRKQAEVLTLLSIPTSNGFNIWYAETIRRIKKNK